MAAVHVLRALHSLHRSVMLQRSFGLLLIQRTSVCLLRGLCRSSTESNVPELPGKQENKSLLENLIFMGVDVKMIRKRQPGLLCKDSTNEKSLAGFLRGKGADNKIIGSIITRYPRAITRPIELLDQRWELWRNIVSNDEEIVKILNRSPESFFRSSDNVNLEENIVFLTSLGLNTKVLIRLLTTAPRTFSNTLDLNRQMVRFLEDICSNLGGENPEKFAKTVLSKNLYILIRSTKRVKKNVDILRTFLQLSDSELLAFLQASGTDILDLSNEYTIKNLKNLREKMVSLGCQEDDIKKLVMTYPVILCAKSDTLNSKVDCLIKGRITVKQILAKPKVLDYSTQNISERLMELHRVGYDFEKSGIAVLDSSKKRFVAKLEKMTR